MLKTHNWVLPKRYGDEIATKPPFMYWLVAIFSLPQGEVSEFTARLPGALLSIFATGSLFYFVSKGWDSRLASVACLILIGSGGWIMEAVSARLDLTLSALMFMGFCALYFWEERKLKGFPLLAILLFTAATLTKGPVAIGLPAMVLVGYLMILQYRLRTITLSVCKVFIPVTCLSLVWYYLAYRAGDQAFFDIVLSENLERLTGTMEKTPHVHTMWYLYGTLPVGLLPTSVLFLLSLPDVSRWLRSASFDRLKTALGSLNAKRLRKMKKVHLYSWLVVISCLALFSVPSSKRPAYLLPIYPFVCIALAYYVRTLVLQNSVGLRRLCNSFLWLVILIYGTVFTFLSPWIDPEGHLGREEYIVRYRFFKHALNQSLHAMNAAESVVFILPFLLAVGFLYFQRKAGGLRLNRLAGASYAVYLTLLVVVNGIILPTSATVLSPKSYAQSLAPPGESKAMYTFREPFYEMNFYLGNRLRLYREGEKLEDVTYFLVFDNKHFGDFKEAFEREYHVEVVRSSPADAVPNPRPRILLVKLTRVGLR